MKERLSKSEHMQISFKQWEQRERFKLGSRRGGRAQPDRPLWAMRWLLSLSKYNVTPLTSGDLVGGGGEE